jgi:hypothetical protein
VTNTNDAPTIISTPVTTATEDVLYSYDVQANDIDVGDTLTYSLITAPSGMTIDPTIGLISWTPTNDQVGPNSVTVKISDAFLSTVTQSFIVSVANTNDAPTITSTPITAATENVPYIYDVQASDIDVGDTLTYTLTAYPSGMIINGTTGIITWMPTNGQVGSYNVTVMVSDGNGGTAMQSFILTVINTNDAPTITSTPITAATEDILYNYDVKATDPDGDTLTYSLTTYPPGMVIDSITGVISWRPTNSQVGIHEVTVKVIDGNGGITTQPFTITVTNTNDAPTITSTPSTAATEEMLYSYQVQAGDIDAGDTLIYSLTTAPSGMMIDANIGLISWTPIVDQAGTHNVVVLVSDGNGGTTTQSFTVTVSPTSAGNVGVNPSLLEQYTIPILIAAVIIAVLIGAGIAAWMIAKLHPSKSKPTRPKEKGAEDSEKLEKEDKSKLKKKNGK